jgi:hypothetical protein
MANTPGAGDPTRTARALLARVPVVTWVGIGVVGVLVGGVVLTSIGAVALPRQPVSPSAAGVSMSARPEAGATRHPAPTPSATFSDESPADPDAVTTPAMSGAAAVDRSVTSNTTALALLAELPVKGRAPMTGYNRTADFGAAWLDVDRNGCDTRNDVLARDLANIARSGACRVMSGTLVSPYTNGIIHFVRALTTSAEVQIDHVVSLGDAWQTGAQQLSSAQRISLANDPLNLLAVDAHSNEQKRDGDAATWLPAATSFRCSYVARQISVKVSYRLWVTQAEHDAMARVLSACPGEAASTSPFAPAPEPIRAPAASAPQPAAPAPAPNPAAPVPAGPRVVTPGAFCSPEGAHGVTSKGTPMVCSYKVGDPRLRWRSAG